MYSAAPPAPRLSDGQPAELLALSAGVDSVELKLTIPESEQLPVAVALGIDPLGAQIRQVYFFDTPSLALDAHGVVVRARRIEGTSGDSVVKLRPVTPGDLPESLRATKGLSVEVDALPGELMCSATLRRRVDNADIRAVVAGRSPLSRLLSKAQRGLLAERRPAGLELQDLAVLGPALVLKLEFAPEGVERRIAAELWLYPDGSRVLELSTRTRPRAAFAAAAEMRALLARRGIDLSGEQQPKTRRALGFFSERVASAADLARIEAHHQDETTAATR